MQRSRPRAPFFFPIILVLVGFVLLLNNFLLIEADIRALWPLLLVVIGLGILWRGDIAPSWSAQTFGITRGSVESAAIEISSAEIDVRLNALNRVGRLIAGQYAARSRPRLNVRNNHAVLTLRRGDTWLFSWADWEINLAPDVPWALVLSSHIGALEADLSGLTLSRGHIASGFGDIKLSAPRPESGPLYVRSALGNIQLSVPSDVAALIQIQASPLARVIAEETAFQVDLTGEYYASAAYRPDQPALEIILAATFGDIVLIAS